MGLFISHFLNYSIDQKIYDFKILYLFPNFANLIFKDYLISNHYFIYDSLIIFTTLNLL